MPTRSRRAREATGRPPTDTEIRRRRQIYEATIAVIGRAGWDGCTLQSVADEIGVTKAAVLYHVGTKTELVRQAYDVVIEAFIAHVVREIDLADDPIDAVIRYTRAHLDHMRDNPDHARVMAVALDGANQTTIEDRPQSPHRAAPLIALIDAAREVRSRGNSASDPVVNAHVLAVVIAGAIDGSVQAWLEDPAFDLASAQHAIEALIRAQV